FPSTSPLYLSPLPLPSASPLYLSLYLYLSPPQLHAGSVRVRAAYGDRLDVDGHVDASLRLLQHGAVLRDRLSAEMRACLRAGTVACWNQALSDLFLSSVALSFVKYNCLDWYGGLFESGFVRLNYIFFALSFV